MAKNYSPDLKPLIKTKKTDRKHCHSGTILYHAEFKFIILTRYEAAELIGDRGYDVRQGRQAEEDV